MLSDKFTTYKRKKFSFLLLKCKFSKKICFKTQKNILKFSSPIALKRVFHKKLNYLSTRV